MTRILGILLALAYDSNSAVIPQRASGYVNGALGLQNANYIDMRGPHGAGGLYSTVGDLLKWTQGLFGGKLKPASLEQMITPFKDGYAFGLVVGVKNGRKRFAHFGRIDGFSSWLSYYPQSEVTIAVLRMSTETLRRSSASGARRFISMRNCHHSRSEF